MTQESLDFGRTDRVARRDDRLRLVAADAVDSIGLLVAAGACDARPSELRDALSGREGRYLRSGWIVALLDIAPPHHRVRILAALAEPIGYVVAPAQPLTDRERADLLEAAIRRMPLGEQIVDHALGNRR